MKNDKQIHPWIVKEAQVVVKVESETTEVTACKLPHLVAHKVIHIHTFICIYIEELNWWMVKVVAADESFVPLHLSSGFSGRELDAAEINHFHQSTSANGLWFKIKRQSISPRERDVCSPWSFSQPSSQLEQYLGCQWLLAPGKTLNVPFSYGNDMIEVMHTWSNSYDLVSEKRNVWYQVGRSWQPFGEGKNGHKIFRQARIWYFHICVAFAHNCKWQI